MSESSVPETTTHHEERRFTKDVIIRLAAQVILYLRGIILLPLIAQTMGKEEYGIWAQIAVMITLLAPILTLRLESAVVRYLSSKTGHDVSKDFFPLMLLIWGVLISLGGLGFAFREQVAQFLFNDGSLVLFVSLFVLYLFVRCSYLFLLNYYRTFNQLTKYSVIELMTAFLQIGLAIALVLSGMGLVGVLIPFILIEGLVALIVFVDIIRQIGFPKTIRMKNVTLYVKYSAPLIINRGLNWIVESSDRILIVHLMVAGIGMVGTYNASYQLGQLSLLFLWPITFVLFPTIAKLWESNKQDDVKTHMQTALRYYLLLAIPSALGLFYLSPALLRFLADDSFVIEQHNLLIAFILLGVICQGITQVYIYVLHLKEKTHMMSLLFIGAAVLNIGLNLWLIPQIGILAAALSTFLAYLVRLGSVVGYSAMLYWVGFDLVFFAKTLIAGAGMFLILNLLMPQGIIALLATALLGAVVYFALMILFGGVGRRDLDLFKGLVTRGAS